MKVKDPHTGEFFRTQRRDQKFANRKNQIAYNNRKQTRERRAKSSIDNKLKQNRRILTNILGDSGQKTVTQEFLSGAGYDFRFFTHVNEDNGREVFFVYEYGIENLGNERFKIVKDDGKWHKTI